MLRSSNLPTRSTSLHTDASGTATPDAFGPFRVLHQIGAGALGPIFRAYDPERDKLVAVKWFRLDLPPERTHRLVAELEQLIAADLAHPAIAAPVATGISGARAYLAQDFVASESVDVLVRQQGAGAFADALRVATALAGALDVAAAANVVHGAMHPRDIFVSPDGIRLTGLGVARALERAGAAAPVRRPYTAPERVAAAPWNQRADIFSLAVLVHEWLWAKRVTGVGSQAAEALTALPGADLASLRLLFARALAERPADRFDTAAEFIEGLNRALPRSSDAKTAVDHEPRLPLDQPAIIAEIVSDPHMAGESAAPTDFDLHDAEPTRYADVEAAPIPVVPVELPPVRPAAFHLDRTDAALDPARSALWPLGLALVIGVSLGFGAGYGVATLQHPPESDRAESAGPVPAAAVTSSGSAARDFTESAVREPAAAVPSGDVAATNRDARPAVPSVVRSAERRGVPAPPRKPAPAVRKPTPARPPVAAARPASARPAPAAPVASGPTRAALTVESRPAGASVFLDGKLVGKTPMQIAALTGEHSVRLERDGYREWSSSVRVAAGAGNRIRASLER